MFSPVDFLVIPLALLLVLLVIRLMQQRYAGDPSAVYIVPALLLKVFGGLMVGVIYWYYYGGGDTFFYHLLGVRLAKLAVESPGEYLQALLLNGEEGKTTVNAMLTANGIDNLYGGYAEITTAKVASVFILIAGYSYSGASILMSLTSFLGIWSLYRVLDSQFPHYRGHIAIACFYIPSIFFWGSGILKDTITLSCLCFITYILYRGIKSPTVFLLAAPALLFAAGLILRIRDFILLSYLPFASFWLYRMLIGRIGSQAIRVLVGPIIAAVVLGLSAVLFSSLSGSSGKYNIDSVFVTAYIAHNDLGRERYYSDGQGSRYELPEFDGTLAGALASFPRAVTLTLFRPFLWESRNPVMLLAAIESTALLCICLYVVFRLGLVRMLRTINQQPLLQFMFTYAITFAFMSALGSGNFGNLVRYKVASLVFFYAPVMVMFAEAKAKAKRKATAHTLAPELQANSKDGAAHQPHRPKTLREMRDHLNEKRARKAAEPSGDAPDQLPGTVSPA